MAKYSPENRPAKAKTPPKKSAFAKLKPYADFPLYAHPSGNWAKKVGGKLEYFGRWGRRINGKVVANDDIGWEAAKTLWDAQKDDLYAGRTPRKPDDKRLTVLALCNRFLTSKKNKVDAGRLKTRSLQELKSTCARVLMVFGKNSAVDDLGPDDFEKLLVEIAKTCGLVRQGNEVVRTKSIFKYAVDNDLIKKNVRYGSEFKKPNKADLRKLKAESGTKDFAPDVIRSLLAKADVNMRAMILLGINAGAGNTDVSSLKFKHLDLDSGWLDYPRPKSGIARRVPLWPETIEAIRLAIAQRPVPAKPDDEDDGDVVFLTSKGERYIRVYEKSRTDLVTSQFTILLKVGGGRRQKGLGFYSLRRTLATLGLHVADRDAVKAIMGHVFSEVIDTYNQAAPSDARLRAVTNYIRARIFGGVVEGGAE